jgi:Asp-tRNA(Asn)/Glu-tRNA(Gln) amidotransferase A subunit family amidase
VGLTGIKPTWGRVSRFGVFALADSLDCVGPMATLPFPVPRLDSIDFERMTITYGDAGSNAEDLYSVFLRFRSPFNFAGHPAISFPAGFSSSGLPIGMQLAGRHLSEQRLLQAVHTFQKFTDWHACHPIYASQKKN